MARSGQSVGKSVGKLVPKVPGLPSIPSMPSLPKVAQVPGASRRAAYSASTKGALTDVAEALFTEQGYASTSLDAIVAGAQVTKGALYHHFSGKQALFEAVFERVEQDSSARIQKALKGSRDPWDKARAGLRAFLDVVVEPRYRRIVIQEGPAVLGYERFRDQEGRTTYANVRDIVRSVLQAGTWRLDEDMTNTFARIFFGALSSAGETVAISEDPDAAAQRVEQAVGFMLAGFQVLVEDGAALASGLPNALLIDDTTDDTTDDATDDATDEPTREAT